jgi:DNA polymerase III epsilon subunit-like protein
MNVFFDVETSGLQPKGAEWESNYKDFPYIVQLSWKRSDSEIVKDFIIKPAGYTIPEEAAKIHGITTEIAIEKGVLFEKVINLFISDCAEAQYVIGHNCYFDTSNLKANTLKLIESGKLSSDTIERLNSSIDKEKRIDTMFETTAFCNIPFANGRGKKWPKLEELYFKLFNETFNAHNSKDDALATERCYIRLVELGIIK